MPSTITITLDAQGNATLSELPDGVFASRFATPPDAQIRDVISINAADVYTIVINAPTVMDATATPPVKWLSQTPTRATFSVDASKVFTAQAFGMALCALGASGGYSLGVLVNPASVSLPIGIDVQGAIIVDPADVPVGVHCIPAQQKISVWAAGGYSFAFSLPTDSGYRIQSVVFEDPSEMFSASISLDGLTAWILNDNMITNPGVQVSFEFICASAATDALRVVIDPTIINNPINQGGGNDNLPGHPESRYEMAAAHVH
jgi:hypothetical protein